MRCGDGADADVGEIPLRVEELVEGDDLGGDFFGRAERERPGWRGECFVVGPAGGRPAA